MSTFTLIVAMVVGNPGNTSTYPGRVYTYMEKGYRTQEACVEAAKPYVAFSKLNRGGNDIRIGNVQWDCVEVKW